MSDSYQAIYDAVRSRIGGGDIGQAVRDVASQAFDVSHVVSGLRDDAHSLISDMRSPSVLYRPSLAIDGDQWCALYGANIQEGVAGFGVSPAAAMADFDRAWSTALASKARP